MQPKFLKANSMKFKENHKTALAKVLSDLVQCDGLVNQGEIDFLKKVNAAFHITSAIRKKATTLSLSDAVRALQTLGNKEKIALLHLFQQLSLSDDSLDPNESLLTTAVILSIGIELPETSGFKAHFVSIPNLEFDTRNAVLYVEAAYDKDINDSIKRHYKAICQLLQSSQRDFFYLPQVIGDLRKIKGTFRDTLSYIDPTLSDDQVDLIDSKVYQLDSAALSKEIFLNYLKEVDQVITQREIRQRLHVTMLEILDESEQHSHKCQADPYDASLHDIGDDESVTRTRFVVKHLRIGRQRSQGHGSKSIHDQIDKMRVKHRTFIDVRKRQETHHLVRTRHRIMGTVMGNTTHQVIMCQHDTLRST